MSEMKTDFFKFIPVLEEMLQTRAAQGRSGKVSSGLGTLSSFNNLVTLRNLFLTFKPTRTLEVGMCYGGSTLVFTASHRDLNHTTGREHTALDPYQAEVWDDAGLVAIERAGLSGHLDFRPAQSSCELPRLLSEKKTFDMVYVDGSHLFEDVFVDFYYVSRLLSQGGIVALDDCADPNVSKVLSFVTRNLNGSFKEINLGPYRADRGHALRYRAAKLLGKAQMRAFQKTGTADRSWDAPFTDF